MVKGMMMNSLTGMSYMVPQRAENLGEKDDNLDLLAKLDQEQQQCVKNPKQSFRSKVPPGQPKSLI